MKASTQALFPQFYDERQTASSVTYVASVDRLLIDDGTYLVIEAGGELVACGGWSRRDRLYTGSGEGDSDARLLDPATEPARIRAMFVRADWTRRGLGRAILEACEDAARREGFTSLSLMATLPGVPLYARYGFEVTQADVPVRMPDGVMIPCAAMTKPIAAVLTTERLILRPWQKADREPFAALNADARVMEHFPALMTREQSDAFAEKIEACFAEHGWGLWAVERRDTGAFIGFAGLWPVADDLPVAPGTEVGWRLAAEHWNRGFATESARAAVAYGFEQLGLDEIVSFTASSNVPSRRVMEKLGMQHDVAAGFDHPRFPDWPGRFHVVYRLPRA